MKRSEVISYLADVIYECNVNPEEAGNLAQHILNKLENEFGMLPPFSHEIYYKTWRDNGTGHEWEPEVNVKKTTI